MLRPQHGYASLIAICLTIAMILMAEALLTVTQVLPTSGLVATAGLRLSFDPTMSSEAASYDWGAMAPGSSETMTLYVKNNGTIPLVLMLSSFEWEPPICINNMILTWDREAAVVQPGQIITSLITLEISPSIEGVDTFGFQILISGVEE